MENWELIAKYIKEEASEEERKELEHWLNANDSNKKLFEEAKKAWNKGLGNLEGDDEVTFSKEKAWNNIQKEIKEKEKVLPLKGNNSSRWTLRIAATLVLGFFATWLYLSRDVNLEIVVASTKGFSKDVLLADGSKIKLNSNSVLSYAKNFDETERRVNLEGEAFFDIIKNPTKPFVIENTVFEIKVLGTSFNVFAYAEQPEVVLSVVTGTVSFRNKSGKEVFVTQGESAVLNKATETLIKKENVDDYSLAWKTRKLEFKNVLMSDVGKALKSYFGSDVVIQNQKINNCRFTGTFDNPSLEQVLEVLKNALGVEIKKNQKQIVISGKGC